MAGFGLASRLRGPLRPVVRLAVRVALSHPVLHRVARAVYRRLGLRRVAAPVPHAAEVVAAVDPNARYLFQPDLFQPGAGWGGGGVVTVEELFHLSRQV